MFQLRKTLYIIVAGVKDGGWFESHFKLFGAWLDQLLAETAILQFYFMCPIFANSEEGKIGNIWNVSSRLNETKEFSFLRLYHF